MVLGSRRLRRIQWCTVGIRNAREGQAVDSDAAQAIRDQPGDYYNTQKQGAVTSWPRLLRSELSPAESTAARRYQDRIRRFPESRLKCAFHQIVVQSQFN